MKVIISVGESFREVVIVAVREGHSVRASLINKVIFVFIDLIINTSQIRETGMGGSLGSW